MMVTFDVNFQISFISLVVIFSLSPLSLALLPARITSTVSAPSAAIVPRSGESLQLRFSGVVSDVPDTRSGGNLSRSA